MSANKVRVTTLLGASASLGMMNPKTGMTTDKGPILSLDSGNYQVTVGVGTGDTPKKFYPWQLRVTQAHATGSHAYPTGDGSIVFGRSGGFFANGVPQTHTTGVSIFQGGAVQTYGR